MERHSVFGSWFMFSKVQRLPVSHVCHTHELVSLCHWVIRILFQFYSFTIHFSDKRYASTLTFFFFLYLGSPTDVLRLLCSKPTKSKPSATNNSQ